MIQNNLDTVLVGFGSNLQNLCADRCHSCVKMMRVSLHCEVEPRFRPDLMDRLKKGLLRVNKITSIDRHTE